ncbi:hypothetical protein ATKI12_6940 [Kitasatospora sp. Ki12]
MRLPNLDAYDMAGVRPHEAATWPDEEREAYDDWTDVEYRSSAEQLLK